MVLSSLVDAVGRIDGFLAIRGVALPPRGEEGVDDVRVLVLDREGGAVAGLRGGCGTGLCRGAVIHGGDDPEREQLLLGGQTVQVWARGRGRHVRGSRWFSRGACRCRWCGGNDGGGVAVVGCRVVDEDAADGAGGEQEQDPLPHDRALVSQAAMW